MNIAKSRVNGSAMVKKKTSPKKLVPLRKFAVTGIYTAQYLSLLVQRKKLKATKIGRNFFTTKEWFFDYLDKHANDKKQQAYLEHIKNFQEEKVIVEEKQKKYFGLKDKNNNLNFYLLPEKDKKLVLSKNIIKSTSMAIFMVFFVVLIILGNIFYVNNLKDEGRVAGEKIESEDGIETSTSTVQKHFDLK